jgi:hypothetical protein
MSQPTSEPPGCAVSGPNVVADPERLRQLDLTILDR